MAGRNKRQDGSLAEGNHSFDVNGDNHDTRPQVGRTPLPKLQLFIISSIQFAEPITALVIYPFINQFVRDTGITRGDERKTGYYAGVIESVFFLAEMLTVFQWGWLSDRYGRKPVLLLGPLGLSCAMLGFGLSRSFWSLVTYRCLQGVFNGNIGVSKSVTAEITDASNIADAFALVPIMWSVGVTIAPIMGGVLSYPADRWPDTLGRIKILQTHPYFLPCASASFLAFCAFVIAFAALKETLPTAVGRQKLLRLKSRLLRRTTKDKQGYFPTTSLNGVNNNQNYGAINSLDSSTSTLLAGEDAHPGCLTATQQPPPLRAFLVRPLLLTFLNYALLAFTEMSNAALLPLMYSTSIPLGGLGLDPFRIGSILGVYGFINAIIQLNFLGRIIRKFGPRTVYIASYACLFVCLGSYPVMKFFALKAGKVDRNVAIVMVIQLAFQTAIFAAYGSMQIMVVQNAPEAGLGATNGIGQMVASGMRAFAPSVASSLFSISLQRNLAGGNFVYFFLLGVTLVGIRCSLLLPKLGRTVHQ